MSNTSPRDRAFERRLQHAENQAQRQAVIAQQQRNKVKTDNFEGAQLATMILGKYYERDPRDPAEMKELSAALAHIANLGRIGVMHAGVVSVAAKVSRRLRQADEEREADQKAEAAADIKDEHQGWSPIQTSTKVNEAKE